jgi:hypothetical protein
MCIVAVSADGDCVVCASVLIVTIPVKCVDGDDVARTTAMLLLYTFLRGLVVLTKQGCCVYSCMTNDSMLRGPCEHVHARTRVYACRCSYMLVWFGTAVCVWGGGGGYRWRAAASVSELVSTEFSRGSNKRHRHAGLVV